MAADQYIQDLDESSGMDQPEVQPFEFWVRKQRDLVTSVVDFNLQSLSDLVVSKDIDLQPQYQRRFRWDENRQSKLIESFLMNVPVPPVFLNEDEFGKYSVIDGKQRLNAINLFMRGRLRLTGLEVFADINGQTFDTLPQKFQSVIKTRPTLRTIIILRQSDEDIKYEVFQRLNSGGVRVNAQEIRNSAYTGPLNDMILEMSESRHFHTLLHIKNKEKSAIYKEMRDAELLLGFLTFRDKWRDFQGGIKKSMDDFMSHNRHMEPSQVLECKNAFVETLKVVDACFGEYSFRRWIPEKSLWRGPTLASMYDAQMFACYQVPLDKVLPKRDELQNGIKMLCRDSEFRRAIDSATNTPSYFKDRIRMVKSMIADTI